MVQRALQSGRFGHLCCTTKAASDAGLDVTQATVELVTSANEKHEPGEW